MDLQTVPGVRETDDFAVSAVGTSMRPVSRAYAGVGSRQTPPDILEMMELIGAHLARAGWTLRSGSAEGADKAFERGADAAQGAKEIYRPEHVTPAAWSLAQAHHPAWHKLGVTARRLIARNGFQVFGSGLADPVARVICWTPDGVESGATTARTGGTGQAIRLAAAYGIPVSNLGNPTTRDQWAAVLAQIAGYYS
jgi:hypothetical protein